MARKTNKKKTTRGTVKDILKADPLELLDPITAYIGTGSTQLDLAISNKFPDGGYAVGRITHIYGAASTAKTCLAQIALGYMLRMGGLSFFADTEGTFDPVWAAQFGLDVTHKNFFYGYPRKAVETKEIEQHCCPLTIEEFFDDYIKWVSAQAAPNIPKLLLADSLSALPSMAELDSRLDEGTYGMSRAKQFSRAYRQYRQFLSKNNIAIIGIDQTRTNVNKSFGDKTTVSGGSALEFYATTRIKLIKQGVLKNENEVEIGLDVGFKITKNKACAPFKEGFFTVIWDYGLDNISDNVDFLNDYAGDVFPERKKVGWIVFQEKSWRKDDLIKHIEKNNLEVELAKDVVDVWRGIYKSSERKPRRWEI